MSGHSCCSPPAKHGDVCPHNGLRGRDVRRETVEALLTHEARSRLSDGPSFICLAPDCPVVYFGPAGLFEVGDLQTRVGFKTHESPRPVCYCFDHTVESIEEEILRTGRSTVLELIKSQIKAGRCECETKNPKGKCCLGDVAASVKIIHDKLAVSSRIS